jgi:hypothetical protein
MFVSKKYASSGGHQLYKIDEVVNDEIKIRTTRAQGDEEEVDIPSRNTFPSAEAIT